MVSETSLRHHIPYTGNCTDELVRMMFERLVGSSTGVLSSVNVLY